MNIGGNFPEDLTQFLLDLDRDFVKEQQTNHSLLFVRTLSWSLTFHEKFIKKFFHAPVNKGQGEFVFLPYRFQPTNLRMDAVIIRAKGVCPMEQGGDQTSFVITWEKTVVVEVDAAEGLLSMNGCCQFVTVPRDLDIEE